jgi:hypothetical protein
MAIPLPDQLDAREVGAPAWLRFRCGALDRLGQHVRAEVVRVPHAVRLRRREDQAQRIGSSPRGVADATRGLRRTCMSRVAGPTLLTRHSAASRKLVRSPKGQDRKFLRPHSSRSAATKWRWSPPFSSTGFSRSCLRSSSGSWPARPGSATAPTTSPPRRRRRARPRRPEPPCRPRRPRPHLGHGQRRGGRGRDCRRRSRRRST